MGFDPVTAQQAAAQAKDWRGFKLNTLSAPRDIPGLLAHFDAGDLTGADGSSVTAWPAAFGGFSLNLTPAVKPTLLAAVLNGRNAVRFAPTAYLRNTDTFGAAAGLAATWATPTSYAFVFRLSSDFAASSNVLLIGSSGQAVRCAASGTSIYLNAGTDSNVFGPSYADGQWHIGVAIVGTAGAAVYVDGYLISMTTAAIGTATLSNLFIGPGISTPPTAGTFDVAEMFVAQTVLTPSRVDFITSALATKWGLS